MTTKLPNEQRILELERRIASLAADLNSLKLERQPSTPDQIIRPVRTVNPTVGSYPVSGEVVPIVFLDATHSGVSSSTTLTERSAAQQSEAAVVTGSMPAFDTDHVAFRYQRQWFLIAATAGGGGGLQVLAVADDGGVVGDESNPCTLTYELVSDPTTYNTLTPSFLIRPPFGRMIPATLGLFDEDLNLIMVNEHIDVTTDP